MGKGYRVQVGLKDLEILRETHSSLLDWESVAVVPLYMEMQKEISSLGGIEKKTEEGAEDSQKSLFMSLRPFAN